MQTCNGSGPCDQAAIGLGAGFEAHRAGTMLTFEVERGDNVRDAGYPDAYWSPAAVGHTVRYSISFLRATPALMPVGMWAGGLGGALLAWLVFGWASRRTTASGRATTLTVRLLWVLMIVVLVLWVLVTALVVASLLTSGVHDPDPWYPDEGLFGWFESVGLWPIELYGAVAAALLLVAATQRADQFTGVVPA